MMPGAGQPQHIHAFPLPMARIGQTCEIVDVHGGQGLRTHLTDLGFIPGTKVTIAAAHGGGVIVRMRDTRVMLGHGMAHHIHVKPSE